MKKLFLLNILIFILIVGCTPGKQYTDYVNPFLGTATLWEPEDLGYVRT